MKDEALKLAKSWFEANTYGDEAVEVYEAIEQALAAQPAVQEPVAWLYKADAEFDGKEWHDSIRVTTSKQVADWQGKDIQPLYTTPTAAQPAVPEGWKLVPVEPTHGMVKAFQDAMSLEFGMRTTAGYHARVYSAMLTAAPEKGQP